MSQIFSLTKWYLDCVDERGSAAIVYCARLRLPGVHVSYAGRLTNRDGTVASASSLLGYTLREEGTKIAVDVPRLGLRGIWEADAPLFERILFRSGDGQVRWTCLQPRSRAELFLDGRQLNGLGYAERLEITLPPWKLPMRHLRWGRFVSADEAVTWIDWQGGHNVRLLVRNGVELPLTHVDELGLQAPGLGLDFSNPLELRSGRLQNTVARQAPLLRRLFPQQICQIRESKWLSRGRLQSEGSAAQGWVIHEAVQWGQS